MLTHDIARNLRVVQAFSTLTIECYIAVTKKGLNETIHPRFLESATGTGAAAERGRPSYLILQEVCDVYSAILGMTSDTSYSTHQYSHPHHR